jgi:cysteine sulfinate desulfinase/cysteine desulfurase-like protein
VEAPHVLRAIKSANERVGGSVRFSFGGFNEDAQVDPAVEIVAKVIEKLRLSLPTTTDAPVLLPLELIRTDNGSMVFPG